MPPASIRAGEYGTVRVGVCVDAEGRAQTVEVLMSAAQPRLKIATAKWACRKQFQPAIGKNGKPAPTCAAGVEYTWTPRDYPPPPPTPEDRPIAVEVREAF
jgi:TonB family protein